MSPNYKNQNGGILIHSVNIRKFGNNIIAEIIKTKIENDRKFYILTIKKIITGDSYKIGQTLIISEDEIKYYKTA